MRKYTAKTAYVSREMAKNYDKVRFDHPQGKLLDMIEKEAVNNLIKKADSPRKILDLACGSARLADLVLRSYNSASVVAADISKELLKVAKQRLRSNQRFKGLVLCDAERLPFRDETFDCIIAIRFIGMLPPMARQKILKEMHRVTRKTVILNYPNSVSVSIILRIIWKLKRIRQEYFPISPSVFYEKIRATEFEIAEKQTPLVIPPRRFPKIFLKYIGTINLLGRYSIIGLFSEQYFVLLRKM